MAGSEFLGILSDVRYGYNTCLLILDELLPIIKLLHPLAPFKGDLGTISSSE